MFRNSGIVSVILLTTLFACGGAPEQAQQQAEPSNSAESEAFPPDETQGGAATEATSPPAEQQEEFKNEPAAAEPPPAPEPETIRVPVGTVLAVRLAEPISTRTNKAGDDLVAILDQDLVVDGKLVFPEGTKAYGTLLAVEGSGRVEGRAEMTITLTELRLRKDTYRVETGNITIQAEGTQGRDAKVIGGAAGVGALVGGIIGGKKGAAVGAAVGGGAGTATVLTTKGKEVEFQPEHKFSFSLSREVEATLS
jgi:glucose/arabinose dehydrogenase